jgi:hypothetical protein
VFVVGELLASEPVGDRAGDLGSFDEAGVVESGELEQVAAVVVDDVAAAAGW